MRLLLLLNPFSCVKKCLTCPPVPGVQTYKRGLSPGWPAVLRRWESLSTDQDFNVKYDIKWECSKCFIC